MLSAPIHVAHILGSTGLYGAERWVLALLRHLSPSRVTGTVVNLVDEPGESSEVVRAATDRGIPAVDLYTRGRFSPAGVTSLARFITDNDYDLVHAHGYKADVLGLLAARRRGIRIVSTPHGWSKERDARLWLYERLDRLALRFMDRVCPLSPELREGLMRIGLPDQKICMVMNTVDLEEVDATPPAGQRRAGETVVGYIGQLIRRKNLDCLLTAFGRLAAARPGLRLAIIGHGPLQPQLAASVARMGLSTRVLFAGYHPQPIALLKTFDVLVLPSWLEGVPRCLMEAMAAGIPVVASDIPGNRVLVEPGQTGLVFRPEDPHGLEAAIASTIDQPALAHTMARRARSKIERQFSAQRMADEYTALYEQCFASSS